LPTLKCKTSGLSEFEPWMKKFETIRASLWVCCRSVMAFC